MFKVLDNHIQHIGTNAEICFCKRDEIFAIIWINPDAILQSYESVLFHKMSETYAYVPAPFRNIKCNNAPASIPASLLGSSCSLRLYVKHALPFFGNACI